MQMTDKVIYYSWIGDSSGDGGAVEQLRASLAPQLGQVEILISGMSAVDPIHLFEVAAQQARWLSTSQSVIASNVSNASTPGYKSQVVQPFSEVMDKTQLQLASTNASHLELDPIQAQAASIKDETPWEVTDSGNSVSLEQEMIKANDVNRSYALNTSLVKAFHGMLMASVRS